MSLALSRSTRSAAAIVAGVVAAGGAAVTLPMAAHGASIFSSTLTGFSVAGNTNATSVRVPADLGKQVIVLTGTNFSEDNIASIDLGPTCLAVTDYVVVNPTTISIKTPTTGTPPGCDATGAGQSATGDSVTINEVGNSAALTKAGLYFVPPPDVADGTTFKPLITETSANFAPADQNIKLLPAGGQLVRVTAGAAYAFDSKLTGANALTATLGGKALTAITAYKPDGTVQTSPPGVGDVGNYFTALTPVSLTAGSTYPLVISQAGVSKTFSAATTGLTWPAVPTISSIAATTGVYGKSGSTLKINGSGFSTTASDIAVTICGITAPVVTPAATATAVYVTAPVAGKNASGLGATTLDGPCVVRLTNVTAAATSPITPAAVYVYTISRNP